MTVGLHQIAPEIYISFDDTTGTIVVSKYKAPSEGFNGSLEVVATVATEEEWLASQFSKIVCSAYYKDMIHWHWFDVECQLSQ